MSILRRRTTQPLGLRWGFETTSMIDLADEGDADREDTGCGILYGVLRDSAY